MWERKIGEFKKPNHTLFDNLKYIVKNKGFI